MKKFKQYFSNLTESLKKNDKIEITSNVKAFEIGKNHNVISIQKGQQFEIDSEDDTFIEMKSIDNSWDKDRLFMIGVKTLGNNYTKI